MLIDLKTIKMSIVAKMKRTCYLLKIGMCKYSHKSVTELHVQDRCHCEIMEKHLLNKCTDVGFQNHIEKQGISKSQEMCKHLKKND